MRTSQKTGLIAVLGLAFAGCASPTQQVFRSTEDYQQIGDTRVSNNENYSFGVIVLNDKTQAISGKSSETDGRISRGYKTVEKRQPNGTYEIIGITKDGATLVPVKTVRTQIAGVEVDVNTLGVQVKAVSKQSIDGLGEAVKKQTVETLNGLDNQLEVKK